jgi:hypothetical protein
MFPAIRIFRTKGEVVEVRKISMFLSVASRFQQGSFL